MRSEKPRSSGRYKALLGEQRRRDGDRLFAVAAGSKVYAFLRPLSFCVLQPNELSAGCGSAMNRIGQPQAEGQGTYRVRTNYPPATIWRTQIRSFRIDLFCDGILTEARDSLAFDFQMHPSLLISVMECLMTRDHRRAADN